MCLNQGISVQIDVCWVFWTQLDKVSLWSGSSFSSLVIWPHFQPIPPQLQNYGSGIPSLGFNFLHRYLHSMPCSSWHWTGPVLQMPSHILLVLVHPGLAKWWNKQYTPLPRLRMYLSSPWYNVLLLLSIPLRSIGLHFPLPQTLKSYNVYLDKGIHFILGAWVQPPIPLLKKIIRPLLFFLCPTSLILGT